MSSDQNTKINTTSKNLALSSIILGSVGLLSFLSGKMSTKKILVLLGKVMIAIGIYLLAVSVYLKDKEN